MGDEFYNGASLPDDAPAAPSLDGSCVRVSPSRYRAEVESTTREHVETLTRSPEYRRWKTQYETTPPSQRDAQRRKDREDALRDIPDDANDTDIASQTSSTSVGSSSATVAATAATGGVSVGIIAAVVVAVLVLIAAVVISQQPSSVIIPPSSPSDTVITDPSSSPVIVDPVDIPSDTTSAEALAAQQEAIAAEAARIAAETEAETKRIEAEKAAEQKRLDDEAAAASAAEAAIVAAAEAEAARIAKEAEEAAVIAAAVAKAAADEAARIAAAEQAAAEQKRIDDEAAAAAAAAAVAASATGGQDDDSDKKAAADKAAADQLAADEAAAAIAAAAEAAATAARIAEAKRQADEDATTAATAAATIRAEEEAAERERMRQAEADEAAALKAEQDRLAALEPKVADSPRDVRAVQIDALLDVSVAFGVPVNNGGSEITSYIVTSVPSSTEQEGVQSPIRMSALVAGTSYTFYVVARNGKGDSTAAVSSSLTIVAVPKPVKPRAQADASGLAPCQSVVAAGAFVSAVVTYDCGDAATYTTVTATSQPDGLTATSWAGANITVWGLKPNVAYTFTVVASTPTGTTPVSDESNTVTARITVAPLDWAAYTAVARVWLPSRPYRDQAHQWHKRHEEAVHKVVVYIVLLLVAIKLWSSLHDSLLPQYHPDAITSRNPEPVPSLEVEQNARKRVIDERKANASAYASSPPITPARGLSSPSSPSSSSSSSSYEDAASPPLPNIPPPPPPFDAPPMNSVPDAPVFDTPPASPSPSSPAPAKATSPVPRTATGGLLTKKSNSTPGKQGGDFSLAAMQQAIAAKKSLDELNKTPNQATQRSIASAVAAANAEPVTITPPIVPASPLPSSPAPTPSPSALTTTPGRGSTGSRPTLFECRTLDMFAHLTQGGKIIFIDIRDATISNKGHLPAPHHINIPVTQADVDNKVSLKDIEDRNKDALLFGVKTRTRNGVLVYGQSNEAAVLYLVDLLASTKLRLTNPFYYSSEGLDGFIGDYGTQLLCGTPGTATSLPTMKQTHKHGLFLYPSCIISRLLFLGSHSDAAREDDNQVVQYNPNLYQLNITHILNVTSEQKQPELNEKKLIVLQFPLDDEPTTDILSVLEPCFKFIDDAARTGGRVLLHCQLGISRSTTVAIAYVMRRNQWSLQQAFDYVKKRRGQTAPNPGFWRALSQFEANEAKSRGIANFQSTLTDCVDEDMLAKIKALPPYKPAPVVALSASVAETKTTTSPSSAAGTSTPTKKKGHSRNQSNGRGSQSPAPIVPATSAPTVAEASPVKFAPAWPTSLPVAPPAAATPVAPVFVAPASPVMVADDFLFIGDIKQATNLTLLRNIGITHTLCTVSEDESSHQWDAATDDIDSERVALPATGVNGDLAPLFERVIVYLNRIKADGKTATPRVLVYCDTGASRSAVVTMAYLVASSKMTLKAAYDIVRAVRPDMNLSSTQWTQLGKLEKGSTGTSTVKECTAEYKTHNHSSSISLDGNGHDATNGNGNGSNGDAAAATDATPTTPTSGHRRQGSQSGSGKKNHRRNGSRGGSRS